MEETVLLHHQDLGNDIGGFALVTWDMRGGSQSAYCSQVGPVSRCLVPAFVHDALQRHITIDIIEEGKESNRVDPA